MADICCYKHTQVNYPPTCLHLIFAAKRWEGLDTNILMWKKQTETWRAPPCLGQSQLFMRDIRFKSRRLGKSSRLPQSLKTERAEVSNVFQFSPPSLKTACPVQGHRMLHVTGEYKLNKLLLCADLHFHTRHTKCKCFCFAWLRVFGLWEECKVQTDNIQQQCY